MIPQRMSSTENLGSGLKDRVTACRKRLRESRVMLRAHADIGVEKLFPKPTSSLSQLHDYGASPFEAEQLEEHEVGIT